MAVQTQDGRTFEQRFGDRCPFCGKSWGDPGPCGDGADWSIQDSLKMLFAGNRSKDCALCGSAIPARSTYCNACLYLKTRGNRHRWREKHCERCGDPYQTQKKGQRYCSLSCSNRARARPGQEELAA